MPATIIDALVVTLGLDGGPYKKAAREAAREQAKLKESVKKGGEDISDTLVSVGKQAAALFIGFEGLKGALNFFTGLNVAEANLGRFSKNLGDSAHEVNAWDSAVELAGGSAKDAEADLQSLSSSLTNLKATGDVSGLVLLFQRMNVSLYDAQGKTRKLTDLYKDLGDKLKQYNRADAFNLARNAGVTESTFNLIIQEGNERERLLRLAEQNNSVTEETVKQAAELQEQWRGIGQTVKGAAISLLSDFTPYLKEAFTWVQNIFTGVKNTGFLQGVFQVISGALHVIVDLARLAWSGLSQLFDLLADSKAGKFLGALLQKFGGFAKGFGKAFVESADALADEYAPKDKAPAAKEAPRLTNAQRNNPGNLRFAGQAGATNSGGFAAFPTLAAGIQAANRQLDLYASRGLNTIEKIVAKWAPANENNTPAYIASLEKQLGKGRGEELNASDRQRLLQSIFNQEGSNKVNGAQISGALANPNALAAAQFASNQSSPGAAAPGTKGGSTTTVQIDEINIHTQATDANGIAAEIPGALQRKGVVSQVDSGMS